MGGRFKIKVLIFSLLSILLSISILANATQTITLKKKNIITGLSSGAARLDGSWHWIGDLYLRAGVHEHLELALPLGFATHFLRRQDGSGIAIAAGVTDLWFDSTVKPVWTPGIALFAAAKVSSTAMARFNGDYTWIITGADFLTAPSGIRGSTALEIEMGPYVTFLFGLAYQKQLVSGTGPLTDLGGFNGVSRISIGSVRVTPYRDSPLLAFHAGKYIDINLNVRFDINTDSDTNNFRLMGGLSFKSY